MCLLFNLMLTIKLKVCTESKNTWLPKYTIAIYVYSKIKKLSKL